MRGRGIGRVGLMVPKYLYHIFLFACGLESPVAVRRILLAQGGPPCLKQRTRDAPGAGSGWGAAGWGLGAGVSTLFSGAGGRELASLHSGAGGRELAWRLGAGYSLANFEESAGRRGAGSRRLAGLGLSTLLPTSRRARGGGRLGVGGWLGAGVSTLLPTLRIVSCQL
jgi:hypothetical protein